MLKPKNWTYKPKIRLNSCFQLRFPLASLQGYTFTHLTSPTICKNRNRTEHQIPQSPKNLVLQLVDFTTLAAACWEVRADWVPARTEQVYQRDRYTIALALRTLKQRGWLTISWHPVAARLHIGTPPPKTPDTFTFSQQLRHALGGLALIDIVAITPWERVLDLQFGRRPGEPPLWHLYVEIMSKYSNVILTDRDRLIVTVAHQVDRQQSSVRPILTGQPYEFPPALTDAIPSLSESMERWQQRVSLVPGAISRCLLKSYRGLSTPLIQSMIQAAGLDSDRNTDSLNSEEWQQLFHRWQEWLQVLPGCGVETGFTNNLGLTPGGKFQPGFTAKGYTVMGWGIIEPALDVQTLLDQYYTAQLNQQEFTALRHQLSQKLNSVLHKLRLKANTFEERLQQSDRAEQYRQQADLLMAHLQNWEPGMKSIALPDFETGNPVTIPLEPEKNAIQNAQRLYKQHQKLKRARSAVEPLLAEVKAEIQYLEQVEASLTQFPAYEAEEDLLALKEIREELIGQGYLEVPDYRSPSKGEQGSQPYRYRTPSGFELLIGRNNQQNDRLTFRLASDYDLWFHTQEIPGSHVLLRLEPGSVPEQADLEFAADLAAYYSRARQSDQVPVIYTKPAQVYKPKGAKPGGAIYKQERVIWGRPQRGSDYVKNTEQNSE
jgi:predicted ribosome quality control (RQC) complex YloA/Tae2 family protein